jgi:hypothetical protein
MKRHFQKVEVAVSLRGIFIPSLEAFVFGEVIRWPQEMSSVS